MIDFEALEFLTSKQLVFAIQDRIKKYGVIDYSVLDGPDVVTVTFTTVLRSGAPGLHYIFCYHKASGTFTRHYTYKRRR